MKDLFDRYEHQLVDAGRRLGPSAVVARPSRIKRKATAVLAVAVLVAAGGALAAVRPWQPESVVKSKYPAPRLSADSPPAAELRILSVLRRKTEAADRSPSVDRLVRYAGSPRSTNGVRTDFIRRVGTTTAGDPIVLVPLQDWTPGPGISKPDALCMLYPDPTANGAGKACWTNKEVRGGQAFASIGDQTFGLVPDGVSQVSLIYKDAPLVTAHVKDNTFAVRSPTESGRANSPAKAPQATGWLDASGKSVGPPLRSD
jgi:hypothetical protein